MCVGRGVRRSKVCASLIDMLWGILGAEHAWNSAVSLEGTIIHKSGLITGGRSSHDGSKKWDEKDLQGTFFSITFSPSSDLPDLILSIV